jgi:ferredoxin-NADP reductase
MTELLVPTTYAATGAAATATTALAEDLDGWLTCTEVTDVTHDVKSFSFALPGPAALRFLPGQYLVLRLPVDGELVERCYTISSAPTRPERLTITVKRVDGGAGSNWLHDHVRVGDALSAGGPFGQFSNACHPAAKYLFLTAGSGITPAMSMLRSLGDEAGPADVVLVHCARTPADIIFRDELELLATRPDVSVAVLCEADAQGERWRGRRGRLSLQALLEVTPDLLDREVFTCGPAPFMEAVRGYLGATGADPARCHEESFTFGSGTPAAISPPGEVGATYRLAFRRSGRSVECAAGTTVLEAAGRAGLTLPSSCGEGVCGTCKLTLLEGRVDMQHGGGIRPREVAQNKILPCCSTPLDDLELDA